MKPIHILTAAAAAAVTLSAMPLSAAAEDTMVYGTMNIPYTDFYAAELGEGAGEVDAAVRVDGINAQPLQARFILFVHI